MLRLPISASEVEAIIVFFSFAIGYTVYYVVSHSTTLRDRLHRRYDIATAETVRILIHRGVQVLVLGLIPAAVLGLVLGNAPAHYGLVITWDWRRAGIIAALCVAVVGVIAVNPGKDKLVADYPQMRIPVWQASHILINTAGWAAYLVAYELMFRGFMLQALLPFGVWVAVSVNIGIYVLAHIPKGLSEAIGAVPFGLLVCGFTIAYGTIWAAFWLHLSLALANSFVALGINPEMRITVRRRYSDKR